MKRFYFLTILLLADVIFNPLSAGWVVTLRHNSQDGLILYETLMIEGNMVKSIRLKGTFVYDLRSGNFTLVSASELAYWQGDVFTFRAQLDSALRNIVDVFILSLPEGSREMYAPIFEEMKEMYSPVAKEYLDTINVVIEKTNEQHEIAGILCEKKLVKVDGKSMEQVWIAPSLNISTDFDGKKLAYYSIQISPIIQDEVPYNRTDAYLNLHENGFMMKSVDVLNNAFEVIKMVEQPFDKDAFQIPAEYRKITVEEIIRKQLIMSENDIETPNSEERR